MEFIDVASHFGELVNVILLYFIESVDEPVCCEFEDDVTPESAFLFISLLPSNGGQEGSILVSSFRKGKLTCLGMGFDRVNLFWGPVCCWPVVIFIGVPSLDSP